MKYNKSKNISNQRFGRLVAIEQVENNSKNNRAAIWKCQCDCGNIKNINSSTLRSGRGKSCGCYKKDLENGLLWTGHGEIGSWYWNAIKQSARARKHEFLISVEYAWDLFLLQKRKCALTGFDLFFAHQAKNRSKDQTASLDRISSDCGYIIGNIQWLHKDVNYMKQDYNNEYFREICNCVYKNSLNQSINSI